MSSPSTERLLDRVRKLLALASSDNVHEAALAASRAQELIEEHRLQAFLDAEAAAEERDAVDPILDGAGDPLEATKRLRKWRVVLAMRLAELNGCIAYTVAYGREKRLLVSGREADREIVKELYAWLCQRLEWLSATHAPASGADKRWHEGFRIGAADVIVDRLEESRASRRDRLDAEGTVSTAALARLDASLVARKEDVERFAEEELHLKPGRAVMVDADGFARGKRAGKDFELPE